jgi:hypothetical protein
VTALVRLLAAFALLIGSAAVIFVALLRLAPPIFRFPIRYRGRRPAGAEAPGGQRPSGLPPVHADVVHGPTAPPPAGGRALSLDRSDRLGAVGMGRKPKGLPKDPA